MTIRKKGQTLKDWEDWCNHELTPPHNLYGELRHQMHYVTEALQEAIKHLRRVERGLPIIHYKPQRPRLIGKERKMHGVHGNK